MKTQVYIAEVLPANFHQQEVCCVGKRSTLTLQFSTRRKSDAPTIPLLLDDQQPIIPSVTAAKHNWGASPYVAELKPQFVIGITLLFQHSFLLCNLCWLFSNVLRSSLCSSDNNCFYWFCYPTLVPRKYSFSAWSEVYKRLRKVCCIRAVSSRFLATRNLICVADIWWLDSLVVFIISFLNLIICVI